VTKVGRQGVVEVFEEVMRSYAEKVSDNTPVEQHGPPPHAFMTLGMFAQSILNRMVNDTHCYELDNDMYNFILEVQDPQLCNNEDELLDEEFRPCDDHMFITMDVNEVSSTGFFISRHDDDSDEYEMFYVDPQDYEFRTIATIQIGGPNILKAIHLDEELEKEAPEVAGRVLTAISLIKNPRFVVRGPAGTRQQRRNMHRGFGKSVDSWHRVSWSVFSPTVSRESRDSTFHKMPLHYCRGHWRKAKKDHPKSRQRQKALNAYHRHEWWTWIEGYWRGHPAFGFKKQYHRPTL